MDLRDAQVERITLNGEDLDPASAYADHRIALTDLAAENELIVEARCKYTNTGEGLHRVVDPADGEVYLYSQFEVPDSRRVFAVFEQPDLKAAFTFHVTAPAHWQVISNAPTPEPSAPQTRDGVELATWDFPATQRMSSYITALVAGPYDVFRDTAPSRNGGIPLGIFCRKSMTQYLDHEDLFDLTKRGFAFFEEEFDYPYPFEKYDQIFTPEYNAGAMENAGCVTITEAYIFRSKVSDALIERRALTVLHEQAHMWFGDLVTMQWWDDLWLNESFAEWASTVAQVDATTEWQGAWTTFASHEKTWAYQQDQLRTTHPVVADMVDLQAVEVNFDGITYAKGGSVLKQLVAYVGRDAFREGVRAYFRKHAWGNTEMKDLVSELEAASGRDLSDWGTKWLNTSGVNTLELVVETDPEGTITSAAIAQTHDEGFPTLRTHRIGVAGYDLTDGAFTQTVRFEIDVDGERTDVPQLVGTARPALLVPNDDDLTYCKIKLDEASEAAVLANPAAINDSMLRTLLVGSFWEQVRAAEFPAHLFVDFLLACVQHENHPTALRTMLLTTKQIPAMLGAAANWYTDPAARGATRQKIADVLRAETELAAPGSDRQFQLATAFMTFASSPADLALLRGVLDGTRPLAGLAVDQDLRWGLLTTLAAAGSTTEAEIDAEAQQDRTQTGMESAGRAFAALPTPSAKAAAWTRVVETGGNSNAAVEAIGRGFTRSTDWDLMGDYVGLYHEALEPMYAAHSIAISERFVKFFYPMGLVGPELAAATHEWLNTHQEAPAALRRLVAELVDDVDLAVAAQQRDAQS